MTSLQKVPLLLVTGTVGVGKSSVADEVFEILKAESRPIALVNLDELGYSLPRPADDPFNRRVQLKNLAAMWHNYHTLGTKAMVIPCVVESQADINHFYEAIPNAHILVVRLDASLPVIEQRIRDRHLGGSMEWHLKRASELEEIFAHNHVEDVVINTENKTVTAVAQEVITHWKIDL